MANKSGYIDWEKTAKLKERGQYGVVYIFKRKDGSTYEDLFTEAPSSTMEYISPFEEDVDKDDTELEIDDLETDIPQVNKEDMETLVSLYKRDNDEDTQYLDEDDKSYGIWMKYKEGMAANQSFNLMYELNRLRNSGVDVENGPGKYSIMRGMARSMGLNYAKQVTEIFQQKLNIPFKDAKALFDLPYKMNSWKDLKVNKQMNKEEKGLVRLLRTLHYTKSNALINLYKTMTKGKPLPTGISELDLKLLSGILLSIYKKKGKK